MTLLAPLALLWLGSIPVLVWLWRRTSTHRQIRVPSLVPFEHLLRRPPRRRSRLVVNALFWLQLGALLGLTLAMAQPVLFTRRGRMTLVILDTSASMSARLGSSSALARAQRALADRIARAAHAEQFFLVTTSPVTALTPRPTSDRLALQRAIQASQVSHLSGNLATAARIGRALMGSEPDAVLVVTDEPESLPTGAEHVQWVTVGATLPNVAFVGLDASGPLCESAAPHLLATVQNFSEESIPVTVSAHQGMQVLAQAAAKIAPRARQAIALALPEGTEGWLELAMAGAPDHLSVDNRAWMMLRRNARLPIVVRSQREPFLRAVSTWLDACEALRWTTDPAAVQGPFVLLTDREEEPLRSSEATMAFLPPAGASPRLSTWVRSSDHPVSAYLSPVESVAATLNLSTAAGLSGAPVVSGLIDGRRVPIVLAEEHDGRRRLTMRFDPAQSGDSTVAVLTFLNGVRWLMGQAEAVTTGQSLSAGGFGPDAVTVHRPDGSTATSSVEAGAVRYDETTLAGRYRLVQGATEVVAAVNFFDPLESNLLDRVSTWDPSLRLLGSPEANAPKQTSRLHQRQQVVGAYPLAHGAILLLLLLVLVEWRLYTLKRS
ncbi:MAG: VWA domain-containing protein [Candidatus Omnitrophota bacterium]|nr:VWA domain-containing protein [Candidatus Omnitrophota bacterium]